VFLIDSEREWEFGVFVGEEVGFFLGKMGGVLLEKRRVLEVVPFFFCFF
jgi:hypothetical protein